MALPTKGRVILETSVGEIEIELWSKETPKACRNFVALAMEGYYDGVIFHRIVPGFLVQTGDRTGTGGGGESFYGHWFEDEIHPRLRFGHRGLLGMANNGQKNSNDSQFFITLDRADELQGKHTLFGRVVGNTVFNVLKIGECELDKNERPIYPPKIKSIRIVDNPFDDIVPRITAAEKRVQRLAREEAQKEREEAARRKSAKRNVKLLSFGDAAEDEESTPIKVKSISRPDLIDDPALRATTAQPTVPEVPHRKRDQGLGPQVIETSSSDEKSSNKRKGARSDIDISSIREKRATEQTSESAARKAEIAKIEVDIRNLSRRRREHGSDSEDDEPNSKRTKSGPSLLQQELAKYSRGKRAAGGKGKAKDESALLAALDRFKARLKDARVEGPSSSNRVGEDDTKPEETGEDGEEVALEVDNDAGWMSHRLEFPKDDGAETRRAEHDYEVIDPRAKAREIREEEQERKRSRRSEVGRAFRKGR
ncbi:cyclophilin-like protein [Cantharellus anzutake]|uniref:cyclophilin-like protein n=1 Tax=Cantharellus anzutake TaxID=1750568 RepID=UPI001908D4FD|nr:cyclophilin-like protein [Cantharellus anzutake]KAF8331687.1 cyclophilin-like protein [Cantharellus anzutake]